jgi:hypothetical protein
MPFASNGHVRLVAAPESFELASSSYSPIPENANNTTARLLSQRGLRMWRKRAKTHTKSKFKIMPRDETQEVTGLIVNASTGPTVPRRRRAMRSAQPSLSYATSPTRLNVSAKSSPYTAGSSMYAHSTQVPLLLCSAISKGFHARYERGFRRLTSWQLRSRTKREDNALTMHLRRIWRGSSFAQMP